MPRVRLMSSSSRSPRYGTPAARLLGRAVWRAAGAYLLLLPVLVFIGLFVFWPVLSSFYLSTMDWKLGYSQQEFILLDNYVALFTSAAFWNAMANTLIYTALMGVISIGLGLVLTLAIMGGRRLSSFWQALFFLPVAATMAAMSVVWTYIFDTRFGILNAFLARLNLGTCDWLNQSTTAMGAVILVGIWSNAGYAMVFFIAGLSNIPNTLYEAASIDGASGFRKFLSITWPLLSPTTLFVVIIMTVRALASFDIVKVLTDGGPLGETQVLSHLLYQEAFQFFDTGYASAIAVVFFILVLFLASAQMRVEKWVHYQ